MAFTHSLAFAAGAAAGWAGRSVLGSAREAMVQGLVVTHGARERVRRMVAEHAEWLEDMFAEGRARYEEQRREEVVIEHHTPPRVVDLRSVEARAKRNGTTG